MDDLSRRAALVGATGASLSVLLGSPQHVRAGEPADVTELFVVGPFNLGDWLDKNKLQFGSKAANLVVGAEAREAIVKSFGKCSVYVIDQRIRPKEGSVRFEVGSSPQLAVTGPLYHEWKEEKKQLLVQIASISVSALETSDKKPTPTRAFRVTVALKTEQEDGNAKISTRTLFSFDRLTYDIKGATA